MSVTPGERDFDDSRRLLEAARSELFRRQCRYGAADPRTAVARIVFEQRERRLAAMSRPAEAERDGYLLAR
jgi:hypothetical protein